MSQIEDMPRTTSRAPQDIVHLGLDDWPGGEHNCGIEIALNAMIVADPLPDCVQIDAPIHANDRGSIVFHLVQQRRRTGAEMDRWRASLPHRLEDAAIVGLHKAPI